jgi:hypothetical protein
VSHSDGYDHQGEGHWKPEGIYMGETLEDHQQDRSWDIRIMVGDHPEEAHLEEAHPEEDHQCHFPRLQSYQEDEMTS